MKKGFIFSLLLALVSVAQASPYKTLRMTSGEQQALTTQYSVKRSAIGNPAIASLKVLNSKQFLITAKQTGSTQLLLWQGSSEPTTFKIDVVPEIAGSSTAGVAIDAAGNTVVLQGKTQSLSQHDQLISAAGDKAIDNTVQEGAVQVQTDIQIVEYSRSQLKQIGTALAYAGGDTGLAMGSSSLISSISGIFGDLDTLMGGLVSASDSSSILIGHSGKNFSAAVNALQQNGYAYTLAEPSLVSLSGQTASFLAGGEFPYPVSAQDGQVQIEFKEFGVRLRLTPTILSQNSIMLKVAPEVSDLDFSNGVESGGVAVPALRVRRTDTTIQMAPGESFIISGLVSRNTYNNADKIPGLGDIPILGALFRSTRFEQDDKELVMIVTPHLVKPLAKNTEIKELPGDIYQDYTPSFTSMLFGDPQKGDTPTKSATPSAGVGFSN
ncbi:Type II secretion system protein D [Zhongshania aliphaticivorans]|uniref:Type II secretion system protein D n=1 Tax=Zhongshania aliphaticivorans TaxID=1470434 RepID=A0A5S9QES0_9GAMM|nr:type II and III secretion system protein family protein [Zhongshania aliphaticivorans]CAA0088036.1 Type II secretion system protein D [Zhongshania aliphaticivorans]CAA0115828.1 Type II secretion system protein D [Zhongshania aliphaticivorans]CAA0120318.1 Type II secretion system protein D [Zhongshania aliphaticivorans]